MVRRSWVYYTWRSNCSQHAVEPDIGWQSPLLPTPPAVDAPCWGGPRQNITKSFGVEKLEWCGEKIEDTITRFDRIHERDGQTHRQHRAAKTLGPISTLPCEHSQARPTTPFTLHHDHRLGHKQDWNTTQRIGNLPRFARLRASTTVHVMKRGLMCGSVKRIPTVT